MLLNRATQGLYAPGSTFKMVTTLEYLKENNHQTDTYEYDCEGSFVLGENAIHCYHGTKHQNVNLKESFSQSCNASFANIGSGLNKHHMKKTAEELLFNEKLPLSLPSLKSSLLLDEETTESEMLQYAHPQGDLVMTPMHLNLKKKSLFHFTLLTQNLFPR